MNAQPTQAIVVDGLCKSYGSLHAVDGISFEVPHGIVFGMLGPNGAGKSTSIEVLVGLRQRDAGQVSVLGYDPHRGPSELKSRIGVQLQTPSLYPKLTVREVVGLFGRLFNRSLPVDQVIESVGLTDKSKTRVDALSGGQKHRLAIAVAMVNDGDIIFLDEPTTGLDPQARRNLWDVISDLKAKGKTVFLTTHYMDEAERLCDTLVVVDHGKIIAQGSPRELITQHFSHKAVEFRDPGLRDAEGLSQIQGVVKVELEDGRYILFTADVGATVAGLMDFGADQRAQFDDITLRQATLEDVFLKLTGRRIRE